MQHRRLLLPKDRDAVVELHCEINYACESAWLRGDLTYAAYRHRWMESLQPQGFLEGIEASLADSRTVAQVWSEAGVLAGYAWATFTDVPNYELVIAEIHDLAVHRDFRRQGLADEILFYLEQTCTAAGAHVLRSGTGSSNQASIALHQKHDFEAYRVEYEKVLTRPKIDWAVS